MKLKWEDEGLKSPLARARGLGAAHDGVGHWLAVRISAVACIPLVIWLVFSVANMGSADYETARAWLAQPLNAILMILLVLAGFYHGVQGTQEVFEDYIHAKGLKMALLVGMKLFFTAAVVACVFAILKVAFTG